MTRRDRTILVGITAILLLIILLPLSVALAFALPARAGLTASASRGTIWAGQLDQASLAGFAIGDTRVGLHPLPLLTGSARLGFRSGTLSGILVASGGSTGVEQLTGVLDTGIRISPLPITALTFENADTVFSAARCDRASGTVRATIAGNLGGLTLPGGLSGTLRCDADSVVLPLVGQSGMERIDLRVNGEGRWRAEIIIRSGDAALGAKLLAGGFTQTADAYILRIRGAL